MEIYDVDSVDTDQYGKIEMQPPARLEDEETARKIGTLPFPQPPTSSKSMLDYEVTEGPVASDPVPSFSEIMNPQESAPLAQQTIVEMLDEVEPQHFQAVEQAIEETEELDTSYLIQIRELIAEILMQLNRISQTQSEETREIKNKYKTSTYDAAAMQRELGWHGLKFAGIAMTASLLCLSQNAADREIAGIFAREFCPKLGDMFGSSIQANMNQTNSLAQLILQEYTAKTQQKQSDSSSKQELIGILTNVLQSLKESARPG